MIGIRTQSYTDRLPTHMYALRKGNGVSRRQLKCMYSVEILGLTFTPRTSTMWEERRGGLPSTEKHYLSSEVLQGRPKQDQQQQNSEWPLAALTPQTEGVEYTHNTMCLTTHHCAYRTGNKRATITSTTCYNPCSWRW